MWLKPRSGQEGSFFLRVLGHLEGLPGVGSWRHSPRMASRLRNRIHLISAARWRRHTTATKPLLWKAGGCPARWQRRDSGQLIKRVSSDSSVLSSVFKMNATPSHEEKCFEQKQCVGFTRWDSVRNHDSDAAWCERQIQGFENPGTSPPVPPSQKTQSYKTVRPPATVLKVSPLGGCRPGSLGLRHPGRGRGCRFKRK